jgi:hypothetical protein
MSLALRWRYADHRAGAPHDPATFAVVLLDHIEREGRALGLVQDAYDLGGARHHGAVMSDDLLAEKVAAGLENANREFDPVAYQAARIAMGAKGRRGKSVTAEAVQALLDDGLDEFEIATRLGCHVRTVRRRLAEIADSEASLWALIGLEPPVGFPRH